jgi:hypothetical protein
MFKTVCVKIRNFDWIWLSLFCSSVLVADWRVTESSYCIEVMYVCVKGAPESSSCSIMGLDILGTRHPKLFSHILERMGFSLDCSNVVIYGGVVSDRCQPDSAGRQFVLTPSLYPTDVLNILVETGGFRIITSSSITSQANPAAGNNHVVWTLEK